jgi:hypothetical protein
MAERSPNQLDRILLQDLAFPLEFSPVLHFERNVMKTWRLIMDEVHGVMIHAAPKKCEVIADPIRYAEAKHIGIKCDDFRHVLNTRSDVPNFQSANSLILLVFLVKSTALEDLD